MNYGVIFWDLLKSVLFSMGGFGPLPSLHHDFLENGWGTTDHFTKALTIGQVTPGPNGLWVVSLCYLTMGWIGVILSIIALILPTFIILLVAKGHSKVKDVPATQGVLDGILMVVVVLNIIVLSSMFISSSDNNMLLIFIAITSAVLSALRLVQVNLLLVAAGVLGYLFL